MHWKRMVAKMFFAALSMTLCTCAGPRMTAATSPDTATCRIYLATHFEMPLAKVLATQVGVTLGENVSVPIIGVVAGYYNPIFDHITMDRKKISNYLVVHEYLHRVWFMDLSDAQRRAFLKDLATVLNDPCEATFAQYEQKQLNDRHWLNYMFAWETEAYSDIGELVINPMPPVVVPEIITQHYAHILLPPAKSKPMMPPVEVVARTEDE